MRIMRLSLASAVAAIIASFPPAVFGVGYAACTDGGVVNRWRGTTYQDASQKHGVMAAVEGQALVRCSPPGFIELDGSFVFVNIVPANGGANDIIQVGVGDCRSPGQCSGGMHYYTGVGLTNTTPGCAGFQNRSPVLQEGGPSWNTLNHGLEVTHANNTWYFEVDQSVIRTFPESSLCWAPKITVWFGETWDLGDQIGGTPSNHFRVSSTAYKNSEASNTFTFTPSLTCGYGGVGYPFYCSVVNSTTFDIWTADR